MVALVGAETVSVDPGSLEVGLPRHVGNKGPMASDVRPRKSYAYFVLCRKS